MPVLADAMILSNFAAVDRLTLLRALFEIVHVAVSVDDEVRRGVAAGHGFLAAVEPHVYPRHSDGWLRLTNLRGDEERALWNGLPPRLHAGEAVSLAVAACRGWHLLTDDRDARVYAAHLGVSVTGTLGILLRLVRQGSLTLAEANELLWMMIERARYRSPITDLGTLLGGAPPS